MLTVASTPNDGPARSKSSASANRPQKPRVSVAAFDSLGGLQVAVDGLARAGIEPSRMMVIAGRADDSTTLASLMLRYGAKPLMLGMGLRRSKWSPQPHDSEALSPTGGTELMNQPFETWGSSDSVNTLKALLDAGACALVALVDNPEVERRALEVLLTNSIASVQQHDLIGPVKS